MQHAELDIDPVAQAAWTVGQKATQTVSTHLFDLNRIRGRYPDDGPAAR